MIIQSSDSFYYRNGRLYCEDVPASDIIFSAGTPVFVYSKNYFTDSYRKFSEAFKGIDHKIFYACKSNFNINVIKIFGELGSGADVNSEGELIRALRAGIDPRNIILSGVGKTADEIKISIQKGLLVIKAESEEEIILINRIAGELGKKAEVSVRINPDIIVKTHPYITTGLTENKFGMSIKATEEIFRNRAAYPNINFTGIDMHIGSQITETTPFLRAVNKVYDLYAILKKSGITVSHFDIGGGFGVQYKDEDVFELNELASVLIPALKKFGCTIFFEPGRLFTANAGILLTKLLYTKRGENRNFLITDAAMTDIIRPSLYGTYHHIQPAVLDEEREEITADIVGPVCETGDFLGKGRSLQEVKSGEYLALLSAGAYGMVMSSNYNARRRPPEVIVDGNKFYIVRSRETFDQLLYDEKIVPEL